MVTKRWETKVLTDPDSNEIDALAQQGWEPVNASFQFGVDWDHGGTLAGVLLKRPLPDSRKCLRCGEIGQQGCRCL